MIEVTFRHAIGALVYIKDYPDIKCRVVGLCMRVSGLTYCVCWWHDGKRQEEWLHEWEVEGT